MLLAHTNDRPDATDIKEPNSGWDTHHIGRFDGPLYRLHPHGWRVYDDCLVTGRLQFRNILSEIALSDVQVRLAAPSAQLVPDRQRALGFPIDDGSSAVPERSHGQAR